MDSIECYCFTKYRVNIGNIIVLYALNFKILY